MTVKGNAADCATKQKLHWGSSVHTESVAIQFASKVNNTAFASNDFDKVEQRKMGKW